MLIDHIVEKLDQKIKRKVQICPVCKGRIRVYHYEEHIKTCIPKISEYCCKDCGKTFKKFQSYRAHRSHHSLGLKKRKGWGWNKGKTKDTDERIKKLAEKTSKNMTGKPGHPHTIESKLIISKGMKQAHAEGRAWNIGKNRSKNKPSWPEQFFMKVIENEFDDKKYIREHPCTIYSIDFAWPEKKKAIELDGAQHYRFKEYVERDRRKNKVLELNGWILLRIKWDEMFKDTKKWIKIANDFIGPVI